MDANIKRVLTAIYELEGLLNVVKNRDVSNRGLIDELIREKASLISSIVNEIYTGTSDEVEEDDDEEFEEIAESEYFEEAEDADIPAEETIDEESFEEVEETEVEETAEEQEESQDEAMIADSVEFELTEDADSTEDANIDDNNEYVLSPEEEKYRDYMPKFEPDVISQEGPMAETDSENEEIADDTPDDDEYIDEEPLDDEYVDEEIFDEDEAEYDDDELRVDEQLSRTLSKNLKKAFTLNDRFRFRRELFGNRDVEFNDTLNLVEAMHSFDEAEDYFYNDLQWDKDSPEVADFMHIIEKHFA